jgi:alkanesulfonate monooxygenase SsuD/methylene tetrahydromethanopterin reductase-like flavin-dependent oxidoreductase (luciferase family)
VNAVVADSEEEAARLVLPNLHQMVALRTGQPLQAQLTVEEALAKPLPAQGQAMADSMLARWVVGTPDRAAEQVQALASTYDVDEVMLHPVAGALEGTPADHSPAREQTLRLLAKVI